MQPHYPFIGEKGRQIDQGGIGPQSSTNGDLPGEGDIWVKLQFKLTDASRDEVWVAYRENLELVLTEIENLTDDINGETVLSSDHGNLVGDRIGPIPTRGYGHPPSLYVEELVKIPWFKMSGQCRRITSDPPVDTKEVTEDIVNGRLEQLGYKTT